MKFQLRSIVSSIAFLLAAVKADEVKLFTSDGVVYSYAVVTSTIAPPSVRVETHYYTTFRVRETTLADSEVQTTTEKIISASETTSLIESSTTSTSSSYSSSETEESRSISTLMPSSVISLTATTGSTSSSSSTTISTTSSSDSTISSTSSQSASPTISSLDSSSTTMPTVTGTDGKCTVFYDDDEYYSTVYLTEPNQSVDAATTITSTRLVYETLTLN
ncbi:hypothetical protein HG537_0H03980 [Torulaspora globosa]|uniref:REJ domain-containing protein n=1 Tax=Torulaspora globosa TaxID=48254 RepID=A0A7H9I159_9SACH|nr:hypothetical protein HG537_0H03980 [Torulaspora sp. CBS 2947]